MKTRKRGRKTIFQKNIQTIMDHFSLRPYQFAEKFKVSLATPYNWIHGEHKPRLESLEPVAKHIGLQPRDLIDGLIEFD